MRNTAARTAPFFGLELEIEGDVLRPRAETELLAHEAMTRLEQQAPAIVIDMCCGAGNLAAAIAVNMPAAQVFACDLTDGAVGTARRNVRLLELEDRVSVYQGDLFAPLADQRLAGRVDMIVANPPYISTKRLTEGDRAHLLDTEPREAFDGGPYGIALHQRIIAEAVDFLRPGGWLGMEFGLGQSRQIAALLKRSRAYETPQWGLDDEGMERTVFVRKPVAA